MSSEAQRKAVRKYDAENARQFHLKLNKKTDEKLIEWLDKQDKIQTYIKKLIEEGKVRTEE